MLVDWLPWNHTFGGNHNVGITLYNGGTLYIDDGKPTPARHRRDAAQPARDRADDLLQRAQGLRGDRQRAGGRRRCCARRCFAACKMFFFAGAGLAQPVWDQLDAARRARVGERIRMLTGLGMTETAPFAHLRQRAPRCKSGHIGLPAPGVEVKLVPDGRQDRGALPRPQRHARLLARAGADARGASTTKASTAPATPCKLDRPGRPAAAACMFDGRIAEDFKLVHRHLRQRRAAARQDHRRRRPAGAGRGDRRHQPRRDRRADLPAPRRLPRASPACADDAPAPSVLAAAGACARFFQRLVDALWRDRHRQRQPRRARPGAGRAAVDRQGRDHRQGLDQPARRADPSRRRRRALYVGARRATCIVPRAPEAAKRAWPRRPLPRDRCSSATAIRPASSSIRTSSAGWTRRRSRSSCSAACRPGASW